MARGSVWNSRLKYIRQNPRVKISIVAVMEKFQTEPFSLTISFDLYDSLRLQLEVIKIDRTITLTHSSPSFNVLTLFPKENLSVSGRSVSQDKGPFDV